MPHQVVIDNPILNSPFEEPKRHFRFDDEGITNDIVEERRISTYFVPIAQSKKKGAKQLEITEWTQDRVKENTDVNNIRRRVSMWRQGGHVGVTPTTKRLLEYWTNPAREKKLFFCQIEALETAIYITEVAHRYGDAWIENMLRAANESANPGLPRTAFKMATGSGKTVVMAMLIAWQALNKRANPQDTRFSDTFLIITPGITIRDRLRVLLPNDPDNYYRLRDILPADQREQLGQARILITNFHAFSLREKIAAGKLTKSILADGKENPFTETPDQMVRRVCRGLGTKRNIVVINDEAHHCYRRKPDAPAEVLSGEDRIAAKKRDEEARVWISGIEAVKNKMGVKNVYDLSATPFFLRGSGYNEGVLFPWVVSDFSLIDAIEAGVVKVPRVPVSDNSMMGEAPTYRDLWLRIRDGLPKKGRRTDAVTGEPKPPKELQGALHSLYNNYQEYYHTWEADAELRARGITPPVFIVVCNNTNVSKLVYDYIAGWEKQVGDRTVVQSGQLQIFRNDDGNGGWLDRPNTILVDSEQLESGEAMSDEFKQIAAREIDEFKREYRLRFPGRDVEALTDEDLLREVMNTVGKAGKLGEHVKCVVSVSMLTEGWDAQTVTHVLGVRAFGTQLLCEQVVGRALRRMSYATDEQGHFLPEYAEVYGVPFSFIPASGATVAVQVDRRTTRVRALEDRLQCEITFPRLAGYRYDIKGDRLDARFTEASKLALSTAVIPTKTENAPIVGETSIHTLDDLKRRRSNEVAFLLAKLTLEKYFRQDGEERSGREPIHRFDGEVKHWLFPQLLGITKHWLATCVELKDNTFPQMLLLLELAHDAADRIYMGIVASTDSSSTLLPVLQPYDTVGSTRYVDFDTARPVFATKPDKCHISHVVADTDSWEQKLAQSLEDMPEVLCYVKNHNVNFTIPYTMNGEEHNYVPDFLVLYNDGRGTDDPLHLILEVTGEKKPDKEAKVTTAHTLWVPAVNNHGGFGRWAFVEITDPWNVQTLLRTKLAQ
ncbi:MAG: DEAD/DEAH box helicase family protein [Ignavibacteriae bacterium]|nr:DEAD/DEAH box helicase family protein [Ignavibacteriota bacterium]